MATRTISNSGGNWSSAGTWVEGAAPILGDAVVATGTSGQLTVDVASACTTIDFTNYTNTFTLNNTLSVSGNTTFVAAMTLAGTSTLTIATTATITSNGKTLPFNVTLATSASQTFTLADNMTITGNLSITSTGTHVINSNNIFLAGNFTATTFTNLNGTSTLVFNGSSNQTANAFINLGISITFQNTGTVNFSNAFTTFVAGIVTNITNARVTFAATTGVQIFNGAISFNTPTMTWPGFSLQGNTTITLLADLYTTFVSGANSFTVNGSSFNLFCASVTCNGTGGTGNLTIREIGTTPCNLTTASAGTTSLRMTIDASAPVTIGNLTLNGGSLTYKRGVVKVTGTLTLDNFNGTPTLTNCHRIKWGTITITSGATINTDYFVRGTDDNIITVQASSTTNYNINITTAQAYCPCVKISRCTMSRAASAIFSYPFANQGNNSQCLFQDALGDMNTFPFTLPSIETTFGFAQQGLRGWPNGS